VRGTVSFSDVMDLGYNALYKADGMETISILLVDDSESVIENLKAVLEMDRDIRIVGKAKNGIEALEKAKAVLPSVVIMDVRMPEMDGIEATRYLKERYPEMGIILFSVDDNTHFRLEGLRSGASDYYVKGRPTNELLAMIKRVYSKVM